jgi:hypothetical protein
MDYFHKKVVQVPLYKVSVAIIFTNNTEKAKEYTDEDSEPYAHCVDLRGHSAVVIILNFDYPKIKMNHGVIAHEALHAAYFVSERVGIRADLTNPEPMTYLLEWITNEIYSFMNKCNLAV